MKNKNIIFSIFWLTIISLFFVSCEDEEYFEGTAELKEPFVVISFPDGGGYEPFFASFSEIDNVVIPVEVQGDGVSELSVRTAEGQSLGTVAISDGKGTFTSTLENMGISSDGDDVELRFVASSNGNSTEKIFFVDTYSPITLTFPETIVQNATKVYPGFSFQTSGSEISGVTVETKVGKGGNFVAVDPPAGGFNIQGDSILLVGSNYTPDDTIFVRVNAVSGQLNASQTGTIIVEAFTFGSESEVVTLNNEDLAYDFLSGAIVDVATDSSDIVFNNPTGTDIVGFSSDNGTTFVKADNNAYTTGDKVETKNLFDQGVPVSTVIQVDPNEVYIYKTSRLVEGVNQDYYGILKFTSVVRTLNDENDSFSFTYKAD